MQQTALAFRDAEDFVRGLSPRREMGASEWLWTQPGTTVKRLADLIRAHPEAVLSDFVAPEAADAAADDALRLLRAHGVGRFTITLHRTPDYPVSLRDARHPVEVLTSFGAWNLVESPTVAVIGTRKPSPEALAEAASLVRTLVEAEFTIVSGLASGIDTAAHTAALAARGRTIAVIGTPLCEVYPRANAALQRRIAEEGLVVSQVPVLRAHRQTWRENRAFFPERNATMTALARATVIVEAGERSGTLIAARAALEQRRPLFLLDRCFEASSLTWPPVLEAQGAIRVRAHEEIVEALRRVHRDR